MNNNIIYTNFSCGMRAVMVQRPGIAEHCGFAINAGSRDEDEAHRGIFHFVEHTIFKGTSRRRAWNIINCMEAVGGELNAYTTKEETMVYSTFPSGNLRRAVDLMADILENSSFPEAEIEREREVVADEIDTYLDIPSEGIFDDFDDLIFAGSPLGHNILGDRESLRGFTSEVLRDYLTRFYTPGQMVFFYSGPEKPERVERIAASCLSTFTRPDCPRHRVMPAVLAPFDSERELSTHQTHTLTGARIGGLGSSDRFAMNLLTNILGGPGMNSRLNVALRERRGLVYSIDAGTSLLSDTGLFTIYYGCDREDSRRCRRLVDDIMRRAAEEPVSPRGLAAAKKQYLGQLAVASTNTEQQILSAARSTLVRGRALSRGEVADAISAITSDDIARVASALVPDRLSALTFV